MLGNVCDHRTDRICPEVDVVFEPSGHDGAQRPDGSYYFDPDEPHRHPSGFHCLEQYDTTVRTAVLRAEQDWAFSVTVYLYDRGSRPLG